MKKVLLALLMAATTGFVSAQKSVIPQIVESPVTGMQKMLSTYPYVLSQVKDAGSGLWENNTLNTFIPWTQAGYMRDMRQADWDGTQWSDLYFQTDSFITDGQGKFLIVYENTVYNYPGFTYQTSYRYNFLWSGNQITVLDMKTALPSSPSNYQDYATYKFFYDGNGRRSFDTMTLVSSGETYVNMHVYASSGKLKSEYWINADPNNGDTIGFQMYTWSGDQLMSIYGEYLDDVTNQFTPQYADSFMYDAQGNVSNRIRYSLMSVNGSDYQFMPYMNETFMYNTTGKLTAVEQLTWDITNEVWEKNEKMVFFYDPSDEPMLGYHYSASGGDWSNDADMRYYFREPTSLEQVQADQDMMMYPVPAQDVLHVELASGNIQSYKIIDLNGQVVAEHVLEQPDTKVSINVSELGAGFYTLLTNGTYGVKGNRIIVN